MSALIGRSRHFASVARLNSAKNSLLNMGLPRLRNGRLTDYCRKIAISLIDRGSLWSCIWREDQIGRLDIGRTLRPGLQRRLHEGTFLTEYPGVRNDPSAACHLETCWQPS